jgi:hypothetical protein
MTFSPKLKSLFKTIDDLNFKDFLKSNDFHRMCVRLEIETFWNSVYADAEKKRTFYSLGMDTEGYDSNEALKMSLNLIFEKYYDQFFEFMIEILTAFTDWQKQDLNIGELKEDFKILNAPKEIIIELESLGRKYSTPIPKIIIPDSVWNSQKVEDILNKMDVSIKDGDYNLTLTYAYTCLEGLFKTFIAEKIPEKKEVDKLNLLSTLVRDYIKKQLVTENRHYPEHVLNLIPNITNAISNARNEFSDSHFDNNSEKWLAEFSRDCVNSIARLIIKFIK